jgi:hypothetical protein
VYFIAMSANELGDPWAEIQPTGFAPRSGNKRKRRTPFTLPSNPSLHLPPPESIVVEMASTNQDDEDEDEDEENNPDENEVENQNEQQTAQKRRTMRPAIEWMSVKNERKALNEIRNMDNPLEHAKDKLKSISLDLTVEQFALHYVIG